MPSDFANALADAALDQHTKYHLFHETDDKLCSQIQHYWEDIGLDFQSCSAVPWSAVFVSWCVQQAGADGSEFKFAAAHSVFVYEAINNPGAFKGFDIADHKVGIGDIIQNNRGGSDHDFEFAKTHENYISHSAIVIEVGQDSDGNYALTVGGNEGDSIRQKRVALTSDGFVQQRDASPFICILANNK